MNGQSADVDSVCIPCGDSIDISVVAGFRTQLLEALGSGKSIELDASELERADTAGLQLLSAFIQEADSQQQTITWKDPSPALCESAALLGLSEFLHLDSAAA